jgi:drug/metabolite transporter (DMT)-like permease
LLFSAMSVIWGIPYLFIKIALGELSPTFLVLFRTAVAAVVLLPIAAHRRQLRAAFPYWRPLLVFAALEIGMPWFLVNDAERHMTSSMAGLLLAAVPLVSTLVIWRLGDSSVVHGTRLLGLAVGIAGVASLAFLGIGSGTTTGLGVVEILLVAVGYAVAPIIASRRLSDVPPMAVIGLSLAAVAIAYSPAAVLSRPAAWPKASVVVSVLVLALVCTALAFVLFFKLIAEVGPTRATVITFVNPAVAVLLGVTILDEPFTLGIAIGLPLILAGSALATRRVTPVPVEPSPTAVPQERGSVER